LIRGDANNFLVGEGAALYAEAGGFEKRDNLTEEAREIYEKEKQRLRKLSAYDGHDTVCFLTLDDHGTLCAATSTSGLFMKEPGRVGDTPVAGSGFYADSECGAAAATGMGEEILKGALSYAAVSLMEHGQTAMDAAETALRRLETKLVRRNGYAQAMSLITLGRDGSWGVSTNVEFPFVTADETNGVRLWTARPENGKTIIEPYEKEAA
jgi:isoaspartyl peptidase/L-asparaginase-like protein (Ntn-hydrolase superfamily)